MYCLHRGENSSFQTFNEAYENHIAYFEQIVDYIHHVFHAVRTEIYTLALLEWIQCVMVPIDLTYLTHTVLLHTPADTLHVHRHAHTGTHTHNTHTHTHDTSIAYHIGIWYRIVQASTTFTNDSQNGTRTSHCKSCDCVLGDQRD